jgi:hypothetical protein
VRDQLGTRIFDRKHEQPEDPATIFVIPGEKAEPGRVVLWERHPAHPHPEGEIFIKSSDNSAIEVAQTARVRELLLERKLKRVERPDKRPVENGEDPSS